MEWAIAEVEKSDLRCPLTSIPFCTDKPVQSSVHPYRPSVDRIDPREGYVVSNCRVVTTAINMMLNDWGPAVFERVVEGYRWSKSRSRAAELSLTFSQSVPNRRKNKHNQQDAVAMEATEGLK